MASNHVYPESKVSSVIKIYFMFNTFPKKNKYKNSKNVKKSSFYFSTKFKGIIPDIEYIIFIKIKNNK